VGLGAFIAENQAILNVYSSRRRMIVALREIMAKGGGLNPDLKRILRHLLGLSWRSDLSRAGPLSCDKMSLRPFRLLFLSMLL
jgi:hypothetical protein